MLKHRAPSLYACGIFSTVFAGAYWLSNELTGLRADVGMGVFAWERQIPFVPWTIVPYLSIFVFFVLSFFIHSDRAELQRHVNRLMVTLADRARLLRALSVALHIRTPSGHRGLRADVRPARVVRSSVQQSALPAHIHLDRSLGEIRSHSRPIAARWPQSMVSPDRRIGSHHVPASHHRHTGRRRGRHRRGIPDVANRLEITPSPSQQTARRIRRCNPIQKLEALVQQAPEFFAARGVHGYARTSYRLDGLRTVHEPSSRSRHRPSCPVRRTRQPSTRPTPADGRCSDRRESDRVVRAGR